jgi:hypothetical protein
MYRKILTILFTVFSAVAYAQEADNLEVHDDWRIKKDDDGVRVYVRWKESPAGIKSRQLRVEMSIRSTISAVVSVVKDEKRAPEWINRVKTYYNFDISDDRNWHSYTEFSVPWPLNNQDLVTRNSLVQDKNSKTVGIKIQNAPGKIPVKKHVDRMPHFEGSWEIVPRENGELMVTYKIFTGQKPWLPRWIVDPIIEYGLWKTLIDMRDEIMGKNGLSTRLEYIAD